MSTRRNISFSKVLLLLLTLFYLTNNVIAGFLSGYLSLIPSRIINNYEFWRLFTFPLALNSFESYVLTAVSLFFFAAKIERLFSKNVFPITLSLVIVLYGLMTSLIFFNVKHNFSGLEGISIFLLTLYSFLNIRKRIYINNRFNVSLATSSALIILSWVCFKILSISYLSGNVTFDLVYPLAFGLVSGFAFYLRILFIENNYESAPDESTIRGLSIPNQNELSPAIISNSDANRFKSFLDKEGNYALDDDPIQNEDELNRLLDKIFVDGKESLSIEENRFLDEYSKSI
ncbi:MAG: hypothetical protein NTW25_02320 [Candidatus Kapabacteria bacterium]|nr:hypothetical protein [Candidatus Kapabacteria bacterium]